MPLTRLDVILWVAALINEVVLLAVLLLRRRARDFPIFTLFVAEGIVETVGAMFVKANLSATAYRHYYWSGLIINECLQLSVLYEVASHVFAPTGKWAADVRKMLLLIAGVSSAVAALLSLLANPATKLPIQTFVLRSSFFSTVLMSELFVGMVLLSHTVGLPWKTHAARIAQGLGVYSLICLALGIAKMFFGLVTGVAQFNQLNHVRGIANLGCVSYWIAMLWANAPAPRELPEAMKMQIYKLQRQVENDLIRIRSWSKN